MACLTDRICWKCGHLLETSGGVTRCPHHGETEGRETLPFFHELLGLGTVGYGGNGSSRLVPIVKGVRSLRHSQALAPLVEAA